MPLSRFTQVSRYRNATLSTAKPDERFSELGLGPLPETGIGRFVVATPTSSHILARSSASPNSLVLLSPTAAGKYAKQPPIAHSVCQGSLTDFDVAQFQSGDDNVVLGAASSTGSVSVRTVVLPEDREVKSSAETGSENQSTFSLPSLTSPITAVHFHPTSSDVFLTASIHYDRIHVWDAQKSDKGCVLEWNAQAPQWDVKWSVDGRLVAGAGKDAIVRLWDARNAQSAIATINAHQSKVKSARVSFVTSQSSHLLLTTGFDQMRQREIAIWDHRNTSSPLKRNTLDQATSTLEPICDHDRGMVYLAAKGDSSLFWVDAGSQDQGSTFADGVHRLDVSVTGFALAPVSTCDTSVGEIAKLFVASSGSGSASSSDVIVPYSVRVPRRNYIDFHSDLYPDTHVRGSDSGAISGEQWLQGQDASLATSSMDPALRTATKTKASVPEEKVAVQNTSIQTTENRTSAPDTKVAEQKIAVQQDAIHTPKENGRSGSVVGGTPALLTPASAQNPRTEGAKERSIQQPPAAPSASSSPAQAHWSRRPMAGTTPIVPAYQNLSSLDVSRSPDAAMIAISRRFAFIPISGSGGRLGVHPLSSKGRLPLHLPYLAHGTALVDFRIDPFSDDQVITLTNDGTILLWKIPEPSDGENGLELPAGQLSESNVVARVHLTGSAAGSKAVEVLPHPYVRGLVAVLSSDADGDISLIDVYSSKILTTVRVPGGGLFSGAWSVDGSVLAVTAKDRMLYVVDVRNGGSARNGVLGKVAAHDSIRSFRVVWIDEDHLLTIGHTVGSLRQLKMYQIDGEADDGISEVAKHNMDASPSVLFPHWDADTSILWLWSKGERIVSAFEVQPDAQAAASSESGQTRSMAHSMAKQQQQDIFTTLPAFQHAHPQLGLAFYSKDCLDVRSVEVGAALRLSKTELQRVSWTIPRSRPEFFQDDVYPPTVLVRQPLLSVEEWLIDGKDVASPPRTSLQPDDLVALSRAPPPAQKTSKLSKGPTMRQLTEKEQEDAVFHDIFSKAKDNDGDRDPNHNEDQAARAPDNDDWDDDD